MRLIHVVPTLPPPLEGVGTYALALAGALATGHGIESRFLVGDPGWRGEAEHPARALAARTASELASTLATEGPGAVLVHYANYGYARRGCPGWLVAGLLAHRREAGGRLLAFFHELWASGPPWASSFWLGPWQRRLVRRLARAADWRGTSLPLYADLLARYLPRPSVAVMPVFSTVGEPPAVPPLGARPRRLVVFGGTGARERAFGPSGSALERACRELGIEEVREIGPPLPWVPRQVAGVPVRSLGALPAEQVSRELLGAAAGFLAYPPEFLGKSTIFAAYAAHGLLPVCAAEAARWPADPPLWRPGQSAGEEVLEAIAGAAHAWYGGHSLAQQAGVVAEILGRGSRERFKSLATHERP
ncbi:MAG TPA: glycosyltransferase family 1 protein [Thermoanaerobaculia bacterium]|nr:glycosyltransferase family 1 protein [Thermoanaerobaculia bacterium]